MSPFERLLAWIVRPLASVFVPFRELQPRFIWAKKQFNGRVLGGEAI